MNDLTKLRFFAQKVLPLVYDDSLSYVEVLYKTTYKLNEVIDNYNELSGYYEALKEQVDGHEDRIAAVEAEMAEYINTITQLFEELQTQLEAEVDAKLETVDVKLAEVDAEIDNLKIQIEHEINALRTYLTNVINEQLSIFHEELEQNIAWTRWFVQNELDEFKRSLPDVQNVIVISPISGELMNVQRALEEICDVLRKFYGITAFEYDKLLLTANEYDHYMINGLKRGMTAVEYDYFAKYYLKPDFAERVYYPTTGAEKNFRKVIELNTDLHKASGSYTASEYDGVSIDAETYDGLLITAFEYDWYSNEKILIA